MEPPCPPSTEKTEESGDSFSTKTDIPRLHENGFSEGTVVSISASEVHTPSSEADVASAPLKEIITESRLSTTVEPNTGKSDVNVVLSDTTQTVASATSATAACSTVIVESRSAEKGEGVQSQVVKEEGDEEKVPVPPPRRKRKNKKMMNKQPSLEDLVKVGLELSLIHI